MICVACREARHGECREGSWCDCQHKSGPLHERAGRSPAPDAPEASKDAPEDGPAEPQVNWRRQG